MEYFACRAAWIREIFCVTGTLPLSDIDCILEVFFLCILVKNSFLYYLFFGFLHAKRDIFHLFIHDGTHKNSCWTNVS